MDNNEKCANSKCDEYSEKYANNCKATKDGTNLKDGCLDYAKAPGPEESSGSAEFTGSATGFDVVDAQVKANNMTDILLDGTPQGLANLRGAIATAIMEAYKLGQQNK